MADWLHCVCGGIHRKLLKVPQCLNSETDKEENIGWLPILDCRLT